MAPLKITESSRKHYDAKFIGRVTFELVATPFKKKLHSGWCFYLGATRYRIFKES